MPKIKWVDAAVYPLFVFVSFLVFLPSAQAGAGEDFSNNLFTDLGELRIFYYQTPTNDSCSPNPGSVW